MMITFKGNVRYLTWVLENFINVRNITHFKQTSGQLPNKDKSYYIISSSSSSSSSVLREVDSIACSGFSDVKF
jgi:hypothetical protein